MTEKTDAKPTRDHVAWQIFGELMLVGQSHAETSLTPRQLANELYKQRSMAENPPDKSGLVKCPKCNGSAWVIGTEFVSCSNCNFTLHGESFSRSSEHIREAIETWRSFAKRVAERGKP